MQYCSWAGLQRKCYWELALPDRLQLPCCLQARLLEAGLAGHPLGAGRAWPLS